MAPAHTYAWTESLRQTKAGPGTDDMHREHTKDLGNKWIVLMIRLLVVFVFTIIMCTLGVLEAYALENRSKALLRATHDETCHVHVFPYDDKGEELGFFMTSYDSKNEFIAAAHDGNASAKFEFDFGSQQRVKSPDCHLLIDPSIDGEIRFYNLGGKTSIPEPLSFDVCKKPPEGEPVTFKIADGRNSTRYDARYPPTTKDPSKGCCVPWPLSLLLQKVTGGNRIMLKNFWRTAMRPFVMYGALLAVVFKPFTTIKLHAACPQLVMHTGDVQMTVAAVCLGTLVLLVGVMNWFIDIYSWKAWNLEHWSHRFDEDNECEHSHRWQGAISTFLCACIVLLAIVKFFMRLSFDFIIELRWLFYIDWPKYEVSRWAHGLRVLALILLMVDTIAFLLKLVAKGRRMDETERLKASGYTLQEMRGKGVTAVEVRVAGYEAKDMKAAGYTSSEMKAADFDARSLKAVGYRALEMKAAGYEAAEMKDAQYSASEMKTAGYAALDVHAVGYTAEQMKAAGYTALEMRVLQLKPIKMKALGYTASEMKVAGYEASAMKLVGYKPLEMIAGGYTAEEMKAAGYTGIEMKDGGYTALDMKSARFTASEMKVFGYTAEEMRTAGYASWGMKAAGYEAADVYAAGYTPSEMKAAGYTAPEMKPILKKPQKMKAMGFTAADMKAAGYEAVELKSCYTTSQMNAGGYEAQELKAAGYKAQEMRIAAYTAKDMRDAGYLPSEMKAAGYTASEMNAGGYTPSDMKDAGYTVSEIQLLGYTPKEMKAAGYDASEIKAAGIAALDKKASRGSRTASPKRTASPARAASPRRPLDA